MSNSKVKRTKTPFWYYIILIIIPVVFFVILELALRIFNYGDDYTRWVKVTSSKYILNPDYSRKFFFVTESVPYSNGNSFDIDKKTNAFRVFILGGSSAAGFPYTPNGDFGRYLEKRLEAEYPENKIEVVNLAITAINSYTLRDLIPGVLEQKPDVILIYAGHNEYYGALGAGSMESVGTSRTIVNLVLYLNNFKTTQLVRNTLKWFSGIFASQDKNKKGGTLMARMAQDQLIPYQSDIYKKGIEQFRENLRDMLDETKDAGVPVILSTLTCNLKDQPPFISAETDQYPGADEVFKKAEELFSQNLPEAAESLYVYAKDLDALRFRAPEEINQIIKEYGREYNYPVADIKEGFNKKSPGGITGSSLMTDHLHPVFGGYQLMGKLFYEVMEKEDLLPKGIKSGLSHSEADSIAVNEVYFTELDSTIARYRITILKNDWPFSEPKTGAEIAVLFNMSDPIDSIAAKVVDNSVHWEPAHRMAAQKYLNSGRFDLFTKEMMVLVDQFPYIPGYYSSASETLLENKQYDHALNILKKRYRYQPDAFTTKWIGIIELSKFKDKEAVRYLNESLSYAPGDPQVLFNLAGAYSMGFEFTKALQVINRCLKADPSFPGAAELKAQLEAAVN